MPAVAAPEAAFLPKAPALATLVASCFVFSLSNLQINIKTVLD